MTADEFATSIKQKYPQYGHLSNTELTGKIVSKYPQYQSKISDYNTGTFEKALGLGQNGAGIYNVPVLGGLLRQTVQPVAQMGQLAAEDVNRVAQMPKTGTSLKGFEPKFVSPQTYNDLTSSPGNAIKNVGGTAIQTALSLIGAKQSPEVVKAIPSTVKSIPNTAKYLTKGGTFSRIEKAVQGATPDWSKVVELAKKDAVDETTSVKNALDTLIKQEDPSAYNAPGSAGTSDISSKEPWTGKQALNLRVGLGKRIPSNFLDALIKKVPSEEQAATNILRRAVSTELKRVAPDIKTPDKVYSFYSKIHGDAPTWAKRIMVGEVLKHVGGQIPLAGPLLKEIPLP